MTSTLKTTLDACGFKVTAEHKIPAREPVYASVPEALHPRVKNEISRLAKNGLYAHQANAIAASTDGLDVCLATSTASGKSLVFMSAAADILLRDSQARVLVLYPVKALIQDQIGKWKELLEPLDLDAGFIDGSVDTGLRMDILRTCRVVLMTPDVAHAWFMSHLSERAIERFRCHLRLMILDEAHVYDGVFGTNMAFFLRRLQAVSSSHRLICSTATLGAPADFIYQLTGRRTQEFSGKDDGSRMSPKEILLCRKEGDTFEASASLLRKLVDEAQGRFLAFADSRKMVEMIAAASYRNSDGEGIDAESPSPDTKQDRRVIPYRAGYESEDRKEIQSALAEGRLKGVVSTSALELGLDIGEIDLVILLNTPVSLKAFWQRMGRAGRKNAGTCVIIDSRKIVSDGVDGLSDYLKRPIERNWLYVANRYAQYSHALCAAAEFTECAGNVDKSNFQSLPEDFLHLLENELNPSEIIPADLYPLKQRAQAGPHREFPLRNGIEPNFKVMMQGQPMGDLSFSQVLREAYPGAIYYYMARPFRVVGFKYRDGEIIVSREKHWTTEPVKLTMVFPDFQTGVLRLHQSPEEFVAEVEMQVSERVTGFTEKRGPNEIENLYGPGSPHSQRALMRFIKTTGVCWFFKEGFTVSESLASLILAAFCEEFGIQSRDLGIGRFHAKQSPIGNSPINGICIFDNSNGSLRLTQRLAENFRRTLEAALATAMTDGMIEEAAQLRSFHSAVEKLQDMKTGDSRQSIFEVRTPTAPMGGTEWCRLIAPNQKALLMSSEGSNEVTVVRYVVTGEGGKYRLEHVNPNINWMVLADAIEPIHGDTQMIWFNPMTGEEMPAE